METIMDKKIAGLGLAPQIEKQHGTGVFNVEKSNSEVNFPTITPSRVSLLISAFAELDSQRTIYIFIRNLISTKPSSARTRRV
jgi:hypothetical protein